MTRCTGHETIGSSNGLFWRSASVKSWIWSAIHCFQLLDYSRNTTGYRIRVNLRGIRAKMECSFANTKFTFSVTRRQRCHKQGGRYISPGHPVADTELQILVCFSSNFVAIFMLCSLVVCLKRKGLF